MEQVKRNKIGILGGNFNPVHFTHLMMADQVAQRLELDKVWLMPEALPPHVDEKKTISAEHRVKMLELAIADSPRLSLELGEVARGGKSYTYDTMKHLTQAYPDTDFYFIIGADCINDLPTWHKIDELLASCKFIATKRPSYTLDLTTIQQHFKNFNITLLETPELEISSTDIRQRIKKGYSIQYITTEQVQQYIRKEELYL